MTARPERPLQGVRVLVTRPETRATELQALLERRGAAVTAAATIAFAPPLDLEPVAQAIREIAAYRWLIFTSATGVRFFFEMLERQSLELSDVTAQVAVVGPGTEREILRHGLVAAFVAEEGHAVGLARSLAARVTSGERALLVQPEAGRRGLGEAIAGGGGRVDTVAFYRTVAADGVKGIAEDVRAGRYDAAIFTSPSTFLRLLDTEVDAAAKTVRALHGMAVVAIGATTLAALESKAFEGVGVARSPSDEGLVAALCELIAARTPVLKSKAFSEQESPLSQAESPRKTPLYESHVAAGARLVDFSGWSMPVQYTGVIAEHMAVRSAAGLFDVSHMGEAEVRGPQALEFLQFVTSNDVARLKPGRAHYTAMTTPQGTVVDDLLIYMRDQSEYLLVINAANTKKDLAWLVEHAAGFDVEVHDASAEWCQLAIQGPHTAKIMERLVPERLSKLRYFRFIEADLAGVNSLISRTGYTGEDGFEIYAPSSAGPKLWKAVMEAGEPDGAVPVGLGARDTLRLEAKLALYGNDIDETTTLLEADLGWIVKLDKGDFLGRDVLAAQSEHGVTRKLVGFEMNGRAIARHGYPVIHDSAQVGHVTSGSYAPFLKKNIGLAYVPVELEEIGSELHVQVRGRQEAARVVPTPFYRRPR